MKLSDRRRSVFGPLTPWDWTCLDLSGLQTFLQQRRHLRLLHPRIHIHIRTHPHIHRQPLRHHPCLVWSLWRWQRNSNLQINCQSACFFNLSILRKCNHTQYVFFLPLDLFFQLTSGASNCMGLKSSAMGRSLGARHLLRMVQDRLRSRSPRRSLIFKSWQNDLRISIPLSRRKFAFPWSERVRPWTYSLS